MKVTIVVLGIVVFLAGLFVSTNVGFPQAVTASIELFNSRQTETGNLSSGFDTFKQDVLIGLEGLWNLVFAGGLTALTYFTKALKYAGGVIDQIIDSNVSKSLGPEDISPQQQNLEQILIDAAYEMDAEALEFAANRLRGNVADASKKWCTVTKIGA